MIEAGQKSGADSFTIAPLTRAIDAADFGRWLEGAREGDRLDYGWGLAPPRSFPVFAAVRAAVDAGQVRCHQSREAAGREWRYFVVRCAGGAPGSPGSGRFVPGFAEDSDEGRVLALLIRTAEHKRPCPSNAVIAQALGLTGAVGRGGVQGRASDRARYILRKLADAGLIAIDPVAGADLRQRRVIRIVATGKQTRPTEQGAGR